ncbi:MAG: acetone carboxylase subunit gamma [Dehalococcoidia bacterium]
MRLSNTLKIESGANGIEVLCAACGTALGPVSRNWREAAALKAEPVDSLGGPYGTGRGLLLRQFSCPQCGQLLDSELALPSDPWIDDRLFIDEGP